ncbi:hypothetical protein NDU88_008069 [Pleurodeles waltl]|uniref:Uncharacterized protein n=1 Tax=Pleurodeles waltl TaxID=8319 RepID=A0AAV7QMH6_PLEWA|nr:hypothetical protein NDU88_008069 [Pleurodeles waltl]
MWNGDGSTVLPSGRGELKAGVMLRPCRLRLVIGVGCPSVPDRANVVEGGQVEGFPRCGSARVHGPLTDLLARVSTRASSPRQRRRVNKLDLLARVSTRASCPRHRRRVNTLECNFKLRVVYLATETLKISRFRRNGKLRVPYSLMWSVKQIVS